MCLSNPIQPVLKVVQTALEQPGAKHKLIANALPSSDGQYWTAILISSPIEIQGVHDKYEVPQGNHELGIGQNLQGNTPKQAGEQCYSGLVCHSTDTDALLGLCHHLLLDATFRLWSYSDSLHTK